MIVRLGIAAALLAASAGTALAQAQSVAMTSARCTTNEGKEAAR
jgi:hypothetical protein